MIRKIVFPFLILISSVFSYTIVKDATVVLLDTIEMKNCFISYVMINGRKYLLKQKKDYKKQLAVVRDALAAHIAKTIPGIAHQIDIIDPQKEFPGKVKLWWPATVHTMAPGDTVRKQRGCKYNTLRLRQWIPGQVVEERGLTKIIIEFITWHQQLPEIVALDLFIGNGDRHCGNLCYDSQTDSFCAIDMDDTFNRDLCDLAYKNLKRMIHENHVVFTKKEIRALAHMRTTLMLLVNHNMPYDTIQKLRFFAKKAGFVKGNKLYDERAERRLSHYEAMIIRTYESAYRLIGLLDQIIR